MKYELLKEMYEMEENYWWHKAKRKYVLSLIRKFGKSKRQKFLDVGCGTGYLLKELGKFGEAYGSDTSADSLNFCRKRGLKKIKQIDIDKESFPKIKFDVITALDIVEHTKNDYVAMKNIVKSLKKDGILIFTVPAFPALWSYWDEVAGHYRRYDRQSIIKLFKASGLKIEFMRFTNVTTFLPAVFTRIIKQRWGLNKSEKYMSDFIKVPKFVNQLCYVILMIEMIISAYVPLPFGLSFIVVGRKRE